jgi:acetyl esterase
VGGGLVVAGAATGLPMLAAAQDASPVATPAPGGVEVDPQMQEVLDALASFDAPPLAEVTPQVGRELTSFADAVQKVLTDRGEPSQEPVGDIGHVLIPGIDGNEIVARLYYPQGEATDLLPVAVYFHGGGFVIANIATYDASCRAIANAAGCIVASVGYRQAPENPFPAAPNDAFSAVQYFMSSAGEVGGDPERVAVIGESAGGNLATVVCLLARDQGATMPVHQVLVYPVTTFAPEGEATASIEQFANAAPLNAAALEWFGQYYLADPAAASDPNVSPLNAADLSGLPPATIIQAEIDPLQSQGVLYADALEAAGVAVTRTLYEGVTHEFFGMGAFVDKAADAVAVVAEQLGTAFETA